MKWLKERAFEQPDQLFINDLSYRQALIQTITRAGQLAQIADERVALQAENTVSSLLTLFALLALGKEVLMLNRHLTKLEVKEQLETLEIQTIVNPGDLPAVRPESAPDLNFEPADDKIAVLMNTSATTGKFKTVPISWGMISAQVKMSAERIGVEPDDNWLVVLPTFHVSGLSIIMRTLFNGTRVTLLEHFESGQVLELAQSGQINMMSLVPTQLKSMIDELQPYLLRLILLGGEYIPETLIRTGLAKKLPIFKTYGMTETFSQSVTFNILDYPEKSASVGMPLPGVKLSIKNSDDEGIGEIVVQSPALMNGYLGQEPISELATGDIGFLDEEGFLHVLNRRSDLIISGGENIYPKEIEDLLYQLESVRECAVVPVSDEKWGQVPALFVSGSAKEQDLRAFMDEHLAKYKIPKQIKFMDSLPKNASGKILRKELK